MKQKLIFWMLIFLSPLSFSEPQLGCAAYPGGDLIGTKTRQTCQLRDRICYLQNAQNPSIIITRAMLGDLRATCVAAPNQPPIEFSVNSHEKDISITSFPDSTDVMVTPNSIPVRQSLLVCLNALLKKKSQFLWTEIQDQPFLTDHDRRSFALILQNKDMQIFDYCR